MSYNFKKTYVPAKGYTPLCKIGECSLKKLEFGIIELDAGETLDFYTADKETAFIMLEGHCNVAVNGEKWENIGNRANVFENRRAESFYMPIEQKLTVLPAEECHTQRFEQAKPVLVELFRWVESVQYSTKSPWGSAMENLKNQ